MDLTQYVNNLFIILWNIIVFLCSIVSQSNIKEKEYISFAGFDCVLRILNNIYKNIKELTNKITSKQNNINAVKNLTVSQFINKNKNCVSNKVNSNNTVINKALQSWKLLYIKRLKDAQATQNLVSKQHFFRLQDKCAYLYPFAVQNYRCINCF